MLLLFIGLIFHAKTFIEKLLQRISISLSEWNNWVRPKSNHRFKSYFEGKPLTKTAREHLWVLSVGVWLYRSVVYHLFLKPFNFIPWDQSFIKWFFVAKIMNPSRGLLRGLPLTFKSLNVELRNEIESLQYLSIFLSCFSDIEMHPRCVIVDTHQSCNTSSYQYGWRGWLPASPQTTWQWEWTSETRLVWFG